MKTTSLKEWISLMPVVVDWGKECECTDDFLCIPCKIHSVFVNGQDAPTDAPLIDYVNTTYWEDPEDAIGDIRFFISHGKAKIS